jgi:hypothetical protein
MVAVPDPEFNIKGTATVTTRDWLDERLGSGWFAKTVREKDPKWPERLLPGDWYALRPQMHAWRKAVPQVQGHDSVESMLEVVAGLTAEKDLTGLHRAFLWAANPRMFLFAVPRIWTTYCRFGKVEVVENLPSRFTAHVHTIPADLMDWVAGSFRGFLPPALLLAGGKDPVASIRERRRSRSTDTWEMIYELRYQ